jgi:hypothetical protein
VKLFSSIVSTLMVVVLHHSGLLALSPVPCQQHGDTMMEVQVNLEKQKL